MNPSNPLGRRRFIGGAVAATAATLSGSRAFSQESELSLETLMASAITEVQFGDPLEPGDKFETLIIADPSLQKAVGDDPVFEKKDAKQLAERMLKLTSKFAEEGVGRNNKSDQVSEFVKLMDFKSISTPFCAAGICYAACRAYCDLEVAKKYAANVGDKARAGLFKSMLTTINEHYFFPSASVRVMKAAAIKKGRWARREKDLVPLPGWLIVFSWDKTSAGNHIGMVESAKAGETTITTLEYNTAVTINGNQRDGGRVARKTRKLDETVLGFIKVY
jgi:hypothetical protein